MSIFLCNRLMVMVRKIESGNQSSEELKAMIDSEKIKLLSHILLSRYKGPNTFIPEAAVLQTFGCNCNRYYGDCIKDAEPGNVTDIEDKKI